MPGRKTTRRADAEGSLDLLLDTICNVFGGVIFIAMLVALLVNVEGESAEREAVAAAPSQAREAMEVRQEIATLAAALDEAAASQRLLATDDVVAAMEQEEALRDRLEALRAEIDRADAWLAEARQMEGSGEAEAQRALDGARRRLAEARAERREAEEKPRPAGRLPREQGTDLRQVAFLLEGGRLYWVEVGASGRALLPGRAGDASVRETPGGYALTPVRGRGFAVDDAAAADVLNGLDARRDYFFLMVADDSVGVFQAWRDRITDLGFRYGLLIYEGGRPVEVQTGAGTVQ